MCFPTQACWGFAFFTKLELRANLETLQYWARGLEVPDVIDYADYIASAPAVAADIFRAGIERPPRPIEFFPYPKGHGGLRWMGVCDLIDVVVLRSAAGRVAEVIDPILSPHVHSSRLAKRPPSWRFRKPKDSHERFRTAAANRLLPEVLASSALPMCQTDIRSYYPSIQLGLVEREMLKLGCPIEPLDVLVRFLRGWADRDGLRGLPIGPEFSAVLGNGFLWSVDHHLESKGLGHERYTDDMLLFGCGRFRGDDLLRILDHALMELQLLRALDKTFVFEDWMEAYQAVQDDLLASLGVGLRKHSAETRERIRGIFDEEILEVEHPNLSRFRFVVKSLRHAGDAYASALLSGRSDLMNVDPAVSAGYLAKAGLQNDRAVENVMRTLEESPRDDRDGLQLHLLRALSSRRWGAAEGDLFLRIGDDVQRRSPVRAWAWMAVRGTPVWRRSEVVDRLHEEPDGLVRRSLVVTLGWDPSRIGRRAALEHVREEFEDLRYTADWVLAA